MVNVLTTITTKALDGGRKFTTVCIKGKIGAADENVCLAFLKKIQNIRIEQRL